VLKNRAGTYLSAQKYETMSFLFIAIVCSVLLGFIFKLFLRFKVDTFQAIVFNYFTCLTCGWLHLGHFPVERATFDMPWFPYALFLGLIFISGFYTLCAHGALFRSNGESGDAENVHSRFRAFCCFCLWRNGGYWKGYGFLYGTLRHCTG
jgi:hypothetical protein